MGHVGSARDVSATDPQPLGKLVERPQHSDVASASQQIIEEPVQLYWNILLPGKQRCAIGFASTQSPASDPLTGVSDVRRSRPRNVDPGSHVVLARGPALGFARSGSL